MVKGTVVDSFSRYILFIICPPNLSTCIQGRAGDCFFTWGGKEIKEIIVDGIMFLLMPVNIVPEFFWEIMFPFLPCKHVSELVECYIMFLFVHENMFLNLL